MSIIGLIPISSVSESAGEGHVVTAKYPGHVWHVDLTVVPTGGFWTSWLPFALPQCWPFAWCVGVAEDHFSRRVMGVTAFKSQPTCQSVCGFLGRTIANAEKAPRYIVCDRGGQFDCEAFRKWCKRKGIKPPRYGAIGKHGSIAVVERVILTTKCLLSCLPFVPYRREAFLRELAQITDWYNESRPHTWLGGRTPNEVYHGQFPRPSPPTLRAAFTMATWLAVRQALGTCSRLSRREVDVGSRLSPWPQALADRTASTRRVSSRFPRNLKARGAGI